MTVPPFPVVPAKAGTIFSLGAVVGVGPAFRREDNFYGCHEGE